MDSIASSFFIIAFVPMAISIGLFQFVHLFGWLYAIPALLLTILAVIFRNNVERSSRLVLAAALGQWLSLLSWIFSRHTIDPSASTRSWASGFPSIAKAGFPIPAIEIPPSPMGSDIIPMDMWPAAFLNHTLWFVAAYVIVSTFSHHLSKGRRVVEVLAPVLGFYALVANLALFALWYD